MWVLQCISRRIGRHRLHTGHWPNSPQPRIRHRRCWFRPETVLFPLFQLLLRCWLTRCDYRTGYKLGTQLSCKYRMLWALAVCADRWTRFISDKPSSIASVSHCPSHLRIDVPPVRPLTGESVRDVSFESKGKSVRAAVPARTSLISLGGVVGAARSQDNVSGNCYRGALPCL